MKYNFIHNYDLVDIYRDKISPLRNILKISQMKIMWDCEISTPYDHVSSLLST